MVDAYGIRTRSVVAGLMLCLSVLTTPLLAATYYVNAVAGDDDWDGAAATYQSGLTGPKRTIAGIQTKMNGLPDNGGGNTVMVAAGNYDQWEEINAYRSRANWLVIRAAEGTTPVFQNGVWITATSGNYQSRLKFVGIQMQPDEAKEHDAVLLWSHSYLWFEDCDFLAAGYKSQGSSRGGIYITQSTPDVSHITVRDCTFRGATDDWEYGWEYAISPTGVTHLRVEGCEVKYSRFAINGSGDYWIIDRNNFHDLDSDGIVYNHGTGSAFTRNRIHTIIAPVWFTWTGLAWWNATTHVLTVDATEGTPFPAAMDGSLQVSDVNVVWNSGADSKYIYRPSYDNTTSTITVTDATYYLSGTNIGSEGSPVTFTVSGEREYHEDGIQLTGSPSGEFIYDLTIAQNEIAYIGAQTLFANSDQTAFFNIRVENNLFYDVKNAEKHVWFQDTEDVYFYHNTMAQTRLQLTDATVNKWDVRYNIVGRWNLTANGTTKTEDYNMIASGVGISDVDLRASLNTHSEHLETLLGGHPAENNTNWENALYKALFVDYDNDNYTLAADVNAVDLCTPSTVSSDQLGFVRSGTRDAGCREKNGRTKYGL